MYYFATFDVGSPEKLQSAIIDTGSDTMAFPCETCHGRNCGSHQYPRFSPEGSSSFKYKIRCTSPQRMGGHQVCKFVKSYAEGSSLYGFLADDLIRFKSAKRVYGHKLSELNRKLVKDVRLQTEFGCTEKETGLFKTQYADGILGLDDQSEFINSLEQLNGAGSKVFSFGLCFHEHGGIMSIDLRKKYERDDKIRMLNKNISEYSKPLIVPYDNSNMYYEIPLYGFSLGNDRVNMDVPVTMMIDSGTTFSHFPNVVMNQILHELNKWCSKSSERCGKIPNATFKGDSCLELRPPDENFKDENALLNTFPDFHLYLGQRRSYRLRPKNYFYKEYLEDPKERRSGLVRLCMAIKGHSDDKIILGAFSMVDHYFYFDRKTQKLKIFRENCYLRTKNLLAKERILAADHSHGRRKKRSMRERPDDQVINFSIPRERKLKQKKRRRKSPQPRELLLTNVQETVKKLEESGTRPHQRKKHKLAMLKPTIGDKCSFGIIILLIISIIYQLVKQRKARKQKSKLNAPLTETIDDSQKIKEENYKEECPTIDEETMTSMKLKNNEEIQKKEDNQKELKDLNTDNSINSVNEQDETPEEKEEDNEITIEI